MTLTLAQCAELEKARDILNDPVPVDPERLLDAILALSIVIDSLLQISVVSWLGAPYRIPLCKLSAFAEETGRVDNKEQQELNEKWEKYRV